MRSLNSIVVVLVCGLLFWGCTRDDICAETTPTTPLLIITFKDINDPTVAKSAANLTVATLDDPAIAVVQSTTTDSIAIPLKTTASLTEFAFILNDVDGQTPNPDLLTFAYTREDIYVNRACAFKVSYTNFTTDVENEGAENWIINTETLNTTIENVEASHLTIFH